MATDVQIVRSMYSYGWFLTVKLSPACEVGESPLGAILASAQPFWLCGRRQ